MVWTTPKVFVDGAILTAAELNIYCRDNMLETAPAKATIPSSYFVTNGQNQIVQRTPVTQIISTSSAESISTVDVPLNLTTFGPSISVQTNGSALVIMGFTGNSPEAISNAPGLTTTLEVTGASNIPATYLGPYSVGAQGRTTDLRFSLSGAFFVDNLNPGLNTFTMKYATNFGIANFNERHLTILPF